MKPMKRPLWLLLSLALPLMASGQSTINPAKAYAYGANTGWIHFRPTADDGVRVTEWYLQGRAYGANTGWIDLGDGTPGYLWQYSNLAGDYGVNHDGSGHLSGYAYAANTGWINFGWTVAGAPNGPRIDLTDGRFYGYAWSANLGWINLNAGGGQLFATSIARPDTDSDGLGDIWELAYTGNLTTLTPTADPDGDGRPNAAEYLAGTNPLASDEEALPIIDSNEFAMGGQNTIIRWLGRGSRTYALQSSTDLAASSWTTEGTGYSNGGYITNYLFSFGPTQRKFFRVVPQLPLP
jgi:hypothetical protein